MSPNEMISHLAEFTEAVKKFGWYRNTYEEFHERDDCSWKVWKVDAWYDANGKWLFDESGLSEALLKQLIQISRSLENVNS